VWCGFEGEIEEVSIPWLVCTRPRSAEALARDQLHDEVGRDNRYDAATSSRSRFHSREELARVSELLITSTKSARPKLISIWRTE